MTPDELGVLREVASACCSFFLNLPQMRVWGLHPLFFFPLVSFLGREKMESTRGWPHDLIS